MNKQIEDCEECQGTGDGYNGESCQECCEHYELDHDICIDCGKQLAGEMANRLYGNGDAYAE
jgi:hypothetical protein